MEKRQSRSRQRKKIQKSEWEDWLEPCRLCPRDCGSRRLSGGKGRCGVSALLKVSRAALHLWEEPCISGTEGSGTVFFSGCPLHCVYCQNRAISDGRAGKEISAERLGEIFLELQGKGARNINLVTPTHYIPQIREALDLAEEGGLGLPGVFNCGGYERPEALKLLDGYVDIYLTDFKYMDSQTARRYSHAPDYPEKAKGALEEMVRQCPEPEFDQAGLMKKGVIVRHLLLPGNVEQAKEVVRYVYGTYGSRVYLSLMNQYTPFPELRETYPELCRKVTKREYNSLVDYAVDLGVEQGFIQEGETAGESFIPAFDYEGV